MIQNIGPVKESMLANKFKYAEMRLSLGPIEESNIGNGSYNSKFGTPRAIILNRLNQVVIYRQLANWVIENQIAPINQLENDSKNISLEYDNSARPIVAYETNGQIKVRQYDGFSNTYVYRASFSGHEPLLIQDARLFLSDTADTDVHVIYMATDRLSIKFRSQRDQYGIEYTLETGLSDEQYLAQVVYLERQYMLITIDDSGNPFYYLSDLYPYIASDVLLGSITPSVSVYQDNIATFSQTDVAIGSMAPARFIDGDNITITNLLDKGILAKVVPSKSIYSDSILTNSIIDKGILAKVIPSKFIYSDSILTNSIIDKGVLAKVIPSKSIYSDIVSNTVIVSDTIKGAIRPVRSIYKD